jgi:hypothetical protein
MTKIKKTKENPHGLSGKERLVADDIIAKVKKGEKAKPVESTEKFYNVKDRKSASVITSQKLAKSEFRNYILDGLHEREIIGPDSIIEEKLAEGLNAQTKTNSPDFRTRLDYIKEINKIAGAYAPQQTEKKSISYDFKGTPEELDERIEKMNRENEESRR